MPILIVFALAKQASTTMFINILKKMYFLNKKVKIINTNYIL